MKVQLLIRYLSAMACSMVFLLNSVFAGIDPPVRKILDGNLNQLNVDSFALVEDSKFFDPAYNSVLIKPYKVVNTITFRINESSLYYLQSDFSAAVQLRVKFTRADNSVDSVDKTLTVNYDADTTYTNKSIYLLGESGYRVEVKVLSVSDNVSWDVWKSLQVVNELQSYPQYQFSCTGDALQQIDHIALNPSSEIDELPVSWANRITADEYDLEWTYIDSSALASYRYGNPSSPDVTLLFENNASRVTISGTSYKIPLIYDNRGTLFFRVRPVQVKADGTRYEANWSSDYLPAGLGRYEFYGHQRMLNWQATTSFAEDGKRKTVVQYYDGSLRARQTVTKDNTTNTTIVAESMYDYQGRPVIQVLPAPTLSTVLKYSRNFNIGLNGSEYDKDNFDKLLNPALYCNSGAMAMGNDSGTARYYSPSNPEKNNGFHQYIPDAEGYPFTETEYTQDQTGRISRQGGVGPGFRLGSGHETKYFYGLPDQKELDALFGTEVGLNTHYFKTMVRDANGQYSVSYTDMRGRTIATALAGTPPDSIKLDKLASNLKDTITETLSDASTVVIKDLVMESQKGLLVPVAGNYTFNYELNPQSLLLEGCDSSMVCYDCLYDLRITITDDCNNQKLGGQAFDTLIRNFNINAIDTTCANPVQGFTFSFTKFLEEGSYDIFKKLSVSRYGMDYYRDSLFRIKNTCKTLETFIQQQRTLLAAEECFETCESCRDSLDNWNEYRERFMVKAGIAPADSAEFRAMAIQAYQEAIADCDALCGTVSEYNDIRKAMLMDLTPPSGQYAMIDSTDDPYSIFYFDLNDEDGIDTVAIYRRPTNYLDENGNTDWVFDEGAGVLVRPSDLSPEAFSQKFKPSWAAAMLPYHPEYCKLLKYEELKLSHEWERRFEAVDTYRDALAKGYLNPTNGTTSIFTRYNTWTGSHPDPDPIINIVSYNYKSDLETRMQNVTTNGTNTDFTIWGMASVTGTCIGANSTLTCFNRFKNPNHNNAFDSLAMCTGDLDMAWRSFRQMYLELKRTRINVQLKAACPAPTVATLVTAGHHPHFSDGAEMFAAQGISLPTDMTQANAYQAQNQAALTSFYEANCQAYVAQWWYQLKPCNYTSVDSAAIIPMLIQVCKEGADATHPYGSSSVRPSSTNTYRSFEEVIRAYNIAHSISNVTCNAYLITAPKPYDQQSAASVKPVYGKPDSCDCARITAVRNQYLQVAGSYTSFSDFMKKFYQTTISDATLTQLLNLCAGIGDPSCNFLATPIQLPPALQCSTGNVCVSCPQLRPLHLEYSTLYPGQAPVLNPDPTDSVQLAKNKLYEQFLNYRLGFAKSASEYLSFLNSCPGSWYPCDEQYYDPIGFRKTYGGSGVEDIRDLQLTSDEGYVMVGSTDSYGYGAKDAYIIKTDGKGKMEWSRTYGEGEDDEFFRVRQTSDNGFIALGNTRSLLESTEYPDELYGLMVTRIDDDGDLIWMKLLDVETCNTQDFRLLTGGDVRETYDGGFAIVVNLEGNDINEKCEIQGAAWMVIKLDSYGDILWTKVINYNTDNGFHYRAALIEDDRITDGEGAYPLIIAGGHGGETNNTIPYHATLTKLDSYGNLMWDKIYTFDNMGFNTRVKEIYKNSLSDGYRFELLENDGAWSNDYGKHAIVEVDDAGNFLQGKMFSLPNGTEESRIMTPTNDDGYLAIQGVDNMKLFIHKVDAGGNVTTTVMKEISGIQRLNRLVQHSSGSYAAAGIMNEDALMLKLDDAFTSECIGDDISEDYSVEDLSLVDEKTGAEEVDRLYSWFNIELRDDTPPVNTNVECSQLPCTPQNPYTGPVLCGRAAPAFPIVPFYEVNNCSDSSFFAISIGTELYNAYRDSLNARFDSLYRAKCLKAYQFETFTVTHEANEYHYMLYYYDQAGNLVKTVPPEGVRPNRNSSWLDGVKLARANGTVQVPTHGLATEYRYNTLNQVVAQKTPDGGVSKYWYDRLGRLVVSQNAQQFADNKYSYTLYDGLGRIKEVGQKPQTTAMTQAISRDAGTLSSWMAGGNVKEQITRTVYDVSYFNGDDLLMPQYLTQRNLRNRVSYAQVFDAEPGGGNYIGTHRTATYYTYDIHGNVDTLLQDYNSGAMQSTGNRFKKIVYSYDLISGKVNTVDYQAGKADQFYHRYEYDAENKLIAVYTSADKLIWEKEARYEYYRHGPLARAVFGDQLVQGIDYGYTLQGWLKGINSTSLGSTYDMGGDGLSGGPNQYVAKDAMGISLNYYGGDYKSIQSTVTPFPAYSTYLGTDFRPLFNGNISSMTVNIGQFNSPVFYNYTYDQLNRITAMDTWTGLNEASNSWSGLAKQQQYKERVAYDANGNILAYLRNGMTGNLTMDSLSYQYDRDGSGNLLNNRLNYVRDRIGGSTAHNGNYAEDIDDQVANNYSYDAIGNLTGDIKEGISAGNITWTVYGKIATITKTVSSVTTNISYTYDAGGNRISKTVNGKTTWYVRDASGNVMSVYEVGNSQVNSGELTQTEAHLYGSSRLGVFNMDRNVQNPVANNTGIYNFTRGYKFFELSNHLGNVLVTISDKKLGHDGGSGVIGYFLADVVTANDYYPFGMLQPGRKYTSGNLYRYGFNGKENDNEVKGEGNQQDYGMRIYDTRLGKFLSVDPLTQKYPWYTPYQFAGNRPIIAIDLDGLEPHDVNSKELKTEFAPTAAEHKESNDPIAFGSDAKPWKDLVNFRIPGDLIRARNWNATEQTIEGAWGSQTNLDYYTVQITKLPKGINNGGELLEAIRLNLGQFLDDKTTFAGYASDGSDSKKWQSDNPLGSIMSFDAKFEDPILGWKWNLDDASVMTSSYFKNSDGGFWTFSTLSTTGDGYHPIGGTRQFGLSSTTTNGATTYTFYIRAADRAYDAATNIFGGQTRVFKSAEVTWNTVCSNIFMYVNNNGGSALFPSTPISKRVPWDSVKEQTKDK